jgi:hypothetical protein
MEQRDSSKELFGIQEDFKNQGGEIISRSSRIFAVEEYDAGTSLPR